MDDSSRFRPADSIKCDNEQTLQGVRRKLPWCHPRVICLHYYSATMENHQLTAEKTQEFHRRMAAIIEAVQAGIWKAGLHDLLGYATDYAFGQERGQQTLVLKTRNRSAYVRLQWDTILGDIPADRQFVDNAIRSAINELT